MALPALTHLMPVVGVDAHQVIVTPGTPPVPLPHPHVGTILDFRELAGPMAAQIGACANFAALAKGLAGAAKVSPMAALTMMGGIATGMAAGAIGQKVADALFGATQSSEGNPIKIAGLLRATAGTRSMHFPGLHFPLGLSFAPTDLRNSKDAESFMGSKTVLANNDPLSYAALPSMSCWFTGFSAGDKNSPHSERSYSSLPTSVQIPIPHSRPVLVGGTPTANMAALAAALVSKSVSSTLDSAIAAKSKAGNKGEKNKAQSTNSEGGETQEFVCDTDPVNVIKGSVVADYTDFTIPGRLPLVWQRSYKGHDPHLGETGHHWKTLADTRFTFIKKYGYLVPVATFIDKTTVFSQFPLEEGWQHRVYDGLHGYALYLQDKHFIIRSPAQIDHYFPLEKDWQQSLIDLPEQGELRLLLSQLSNRQQHGWFFYRHYSDKLTELVEFASGKVTGRHLMCQHQRKHSTSERITSIVLGYHQDRNVQRTLVSYRYDDDDNLIEVIDANAYRYQFAYQQRHQMVRHTNHNNYSFHYRYKEYQDGISRVTKAWGDEGDYAYQFDYDLVRQETTITNSLGYQRRLQYDDRQLPIVSIDHQQGVTSFNYDSHSRLIEKIDPLGYKTQWKYDSRGNTVQQGFADNSKVTWQYNEDNDLIAITDPNAKVWQRNLNPSGQLISQITPMKAETQYHYDDDGQLIKVTNAEGQTTVLSYDRLGFINKIGDGVNPYTQFTADALGNIIEKRLPNGDTSRYQYDLKNQLTQAIFADNRCIQCQYDGQGNLLQWIENDQLQSQFVYSGLGVLTQQIHADGSQLHYHYDTEGNLTQVQNQLGQCWQLTRDGFGQVIEERDYWGQSHHYQYNGIGHLRQSLDPLGNALSFDCDPLGRITQKIANNQPETEESYHYDCCGRLLQANNQQAKVRRQYNHDGLLTQEQQQQTELQAQIDYQYNQCHQLIEQHRQIDYQQHRVNQRIHYQYDPEGRLMYQQIDQHKPMRFAYDENGRLAYQLLSKETTQDFHYNQAGQISQQRLYQGNTVITECIDYHYDSQGNLIRRADLRSGTDRYQYDLLGQIIEHSDPLGNIHQFHYDLAGNRYHISEQDEHGRVVKFNGDINYQLDAAGQLTHRHSPKHHDRLNWDQQGKLTDVYQPNEHYHYQYDALRRRTAKQRYRNDGTLLHSTYFIWDGDVLIAELNIDHQSIQTPITSRFFGYYLNSFSPLVLQDKQLGIGSLAPPTETGYYFYQNDPNGMPLLLCDDQSRVVWRAYYSVFADCPLNDNNQITQPLRLQGQYFDDETGLHYNRHRYYDPETGIFISQDPIGLLGGVNPYQFAVNTLGWVDSLGLTDTDITNRSRSSPNYSVWFQAEISSGIHTSSRQIQMPKSRSDRMSSTFAYNCKDLDND